LVGRSCGELSGVDGMVGWDVTRFFRNGLSQPVAPGNATLSSKRR